MEASDDVCPTDILIEFKNESKCLPVHKDEEDAKSSNDEESEIPLNDKKDVLYDENCPTAVLVDVPFTTNSYLNEHYMLSSTEDLCKGKNSNECLMPELENKDLKRKTEVYSNSDLNNYSKIGDSPNSSPNVTKLHRKPPSPQSMSHISKEASKVIQSLNSVIFEEDYLLSEEILPIPLNFDDFDLDDGDQIASSDFNNNSEQELLSSEFSKSVITENIINTDIINEMKCNAQKNSTLPKIKSPKKTQNTLSQPLHEKTIAKLSLKNECDKNSIELHSSETQSDSLTDSNYSQSNENDDVFIVKTYVSPQNKENITEVKNEVILPREIKSNKTVPKSLSKIRPKFGHNNSLKNCSNNHQDATKKICSFSKNISTPLKKRSLPEKTKEIQPLVEKLPKSSSVDQKAVSKISRSNTFQFESTKELMSSIQKQSSDIKGDSKSKPSDLKKQTSNVKTPSRRYSICTPSRDISSKLPVTSAVPHSYQTGSVPRYLPQSVRAPRLSFSRSWQQPTNDSHTSVKGLVQRTSACKMLPPSVTPNVTSGMMHLSKKKQPLSQSMSALSSQAKKNAKSTSSKGRFCSKLSLPSPLPKEQDRKLARELFPSLPRK